MNPRRLGWIAALPALLCACASQRLTEDTPASVTVRYDGVLTTLDAATAVAEQTCASHGKKAELRNSDMRAVFERFAHFNCVGR
jgi:hypothetical protein